MSRESRPVLAAYMNNEDVAGGGMQGLVRASERVPVLAHRPTLRPAPLV
jgi:hypothetical protein